MKRLFVLFAAILMVVSILPWVSADAEAGLGVEVTAAANVGVNDDVRVGVGASAGAEAQAGAREQLLERLQEKKEERLAKMTELSERQQERLNGLDAVAARKVAVLSEARVQKVADLDAEQLAKVTALGRARMKAFVAAHENNLSAAIDNLSVKVVRKEEAFRNRVVAQARLELAKERYDEAKERYGEAKDNLTEQRQEWRAAVDRGNDTAAIEHAKAYLNNAAELVITTLEQIKEQAEANDDLSEEEYAEIVADADARIAVMVAFQEQIAITENKEELKALGKDILAEWQGMRNQIRIHAENVVRTQVGDVLSRSVALEQHLDRVLAEMEASGVVVTDLDVKLDAFSELVESARVQFEESSSLFAEAKASGDTDVLDESKELARSAHADLKEAHQILMEIVREVKAAGYDVADDDDYMIVVDVEADATGDANA